MQETLARSLDQSLTTSKFHLLNGALSHIFGDLFTIFIIFFGAQAVLQNQITLGQLIAFHLLVGNVSGPILSLASLWEEWQHLKISRLRLGDILNAPSEWEEAPPFNSPQILNLKLKISVFLMEKHLLPDLALLSVAFFLAAKSPLYFLLSSNTFSR